MEEKILTLHPAGKKGTNILKRRYDTVRLAILNIIKKEQEVTYLELNDLVVEELTGKFDGKIPWYVVTVKLDLEARGMIERIPKVSPQKLRMKS